MEAADSHLRQVGSRGERRRSDLIANADLCFVQQDDEQGSARGESERHAIKSPEVKA